MKKNKNTFIIIRCYKKDDYIGRLCLESWKLAGFKGEFILYSEDYNHIWMKDKGALILHETVANFGGKAGAWSLIECFRQMDFQDNDIIVSCDTDIVIQQNPIPLLQDADVMGRGGELPFGFTHFNGELIIMSGKLVKELISLTRQEFDNLIQDMLSLGSSISDGEVIGYFARKKGFKERLIKSDNLWVHKKCYNKEGRTDWRALIKEIVIEAIDEAQPIQWQPTPPRPLPILRDETTPRPLPIIKEETTSKRLPLPLKEVHKYSERHPKTRRIWKSYLYQRIIGHPT